MKGDSHLVKHWVVQHLDEETIPEFRFKLIASYRDALSRQVAESVRIDQRGEGVLHSRTD